MDQWLDSLSEDWVSQPRSPHSSPALQQKSILRDSPSPSSNASQSRIPRYKPRSASSLSISNAKETGKPSFQRKSSQVDGALKEKTSSNINASQKPSAKNKPHGLNAASVRLRDRQVSTGSISGVAAGTVQHKSSPAKERNINETPEWKRRVLKENVGGDLFSPIGLESVFKPPTVNAKQQAKPVGRRKLPTKDIPSSPPPYPPLVNQESDAPASDIQRPYEALSSQVQSPVEARIAHKLSQQISKNLPATRKLEDRDVYITKDHILSRAVSPDLYPLELPDLQLPRNQHPASAGSGSRAASGNSEHDVMFSDKSRNENISPFYVSRHSTVDGRVEYAAIDMSLQKLRSQMDKMRLQQQNIPTSCSSDDGVDYAKSRLSQGSVRGAPIDEVTSQSLPDDLSMGTDAYATNGGFVSIRRGGYSNDGSFQRRPISPSLLPDLDGPSLRMPSSTDNEYNPTTARPQSFSQTKSRTPSSPPPSSRPQTPQNKSHGRSGSDDRPRSSGSPLKLFDKYDTFTNDRLIRRLSKFEESLRQNLGDDSQPDSSNALPSSPSPRRRRTDKQNRPKSNEGPVGRRVSSFGEGELDEHQFPSYQDLEPALRASEIRQESSDLVDGFRFQHRAWYHSETSIVAKGSKTTENRITRGLSWPAQDEDYSIEAPLGRNVEENEERETQQDQQETRTATGKRLPYSPAKDPAPKRRRTILALEETHASLQEHLTAQDVPVQSMSGHKRKDALYDSDRQAADPTTLAMRQIRQPKVPNSSQVGYSNRPEQATMGSQARKDPPSDSRQLDEKSDTILDPPTQIVAGALATVALNTAQEVTYGSRKASVTTADFFNEAQQIMQLIRAKGRPRSSHTTTEASEIGQLTVVEESFVEESTKDNFSRPPSRECSPHRLKAPERLSSRAVSHLRKFEDDQDFGLALSSSLKTLKIGQSRRDSQVSLTDYKEKSDVNSGEESDPPNIRIRASIVQTHKRKHSSSIHDFSVVESEKQNRSQSSHSTSGLPSDRSNPTGSSHSSTNRMIIAPETVAHLLSDQMAGMVFDREKQLWVKRKSSPNIEGIGHHDHTASEGTEEDLFGDIPDLSVDEMEELQRVKDAVSSVKSMGSLTDKISIRDQAVFSGADGRTQDHAEQEEKTRPRTAEGRSIPTVDNSSAPSKLSHFASSGPQPGTRATSWGDEAFPAKEPLTPRVPTRTISRNIENGYEEPVEHEISIFEGRESHGPKQRSERNHQARVVTVAFSSPLVEPREPDFRQDDDLDSDEGDRELSLNDSPVRYVSRQEATAKLPFSNASARHPGRRNSSRRMSMNNQSYLARPMSRLDEEDEMSLIHCSVSNRHMSMEVAITTPLPTSRSLMMPPSTSGRSSVGFHLSPLPDFTMHQIDKPIDGDRVQVAKRLPPMENNNRLSLAAQDLVKNLTDLEPYEPYWDYLRSVDLRDRDLGTLHMLDEFCGRVEDLDVSENQIRELNGIPDSVRQLNIHGNCLSDLAAWDSLCNLQYLDVSNNKISNLQGFQNLFHLRSLKADNNEIKSISGLEYLNGLTTLRLGGNRLRVVDFEKFDL